MRGDERTGEVGYEGGYCATLCTLCVCTDKVCSETTAPLWLVFGVLLSVVSCFLLVRVGAMLPVDGVGG
jgi:hypothetical protein